MDTLFGVLTFFTGLGAVLFGVCPLAAFLWCASPLDRLIRVSECVYDYPDQCIYGFFILLGTGFTVGWILVGLRVFKVV